MSAEREILWEGARVYELVHRLAHGGALGRRDLPTVVDLGEHVRDVVVRAAQSAAVEVTPAAVTDLASPAEVRGLAPSIVRVVLDGATFFVGIVACSSRSVTVLDPSGRCRRIRYDALAALTALPPPAERAAVAEELVTTAGLEESAASALRVSLWGALHDGRRFEVWTLRKDPSAGMLAQLRRVGMTKRLVFVLGLYVLRSLLLVFSWWLLGRGAVEGSLERGVVAAWALVLLTYAAVSMSAEWVSGVLLLAVNALYRRKILHGVMKLHPERLRRIGSGQLLGKAIETESLDSLAVSAALGGLGALVDLGTAVAVFLAVPGAPGLAALYALWIVLVAWRGWRLYETQRAWTRMRVDMANGMVESLIGRQTRVAQERRETLHVSEDRELAAYSAAAARLDARRARYAAVSTQGWLAFSILAMAPLAAAQASTTGIFAALVGCIVMSYRALGSLTSSLEAFSSVLVSWEQASILYRSSATPDRVGLPEITELQAARRVPSRDGDLLLTATGLRFAHPDREPVLENASLAVRRGERVLVEGRSGSGKTTLATLLSGLSKPGAGVLLLQGFDLATLGERQWSKRIAYTPQFKDNYVFSNSLAFNLLLGRRWPPTGGDLAEAEEVCRALGLGPLLDRMPSGMHELVGEAGWVLSHGERSRIFLARALLQDPDLVILDESFGALDAETTKRCVRYVLERAPALVAIAHP